ncbi:response regulator [Paenibacillus sp. L3-i20]|uniref:response regulator n=1 Tax=Paenibacillus sp. L3-i20 TaxID=2905833 RepID=UPI001EE07E01|nr:response regulator [Paenibacillus sp. L3-i20]GKU76601.1 AraC family transcriptional regulator [Paenibacillus sp. L3-i20]
MSQLLIVDDEAHVVERLAELVPWEQVGVVTVHKAYSAYEAIEKLHEHPIDVVITDIHMPGMTGLELSALIRMKWKKIQCILLSGHADFEYAKKAINQGAWSYLLKPVTDEELLVTVSQALQKIQAEWEQVLSSGKVSRTLRENLPQLRANLLNELLQGRRLSDSELQDRLSMLQLPDFHGDVFWSMLVRLEEPFYGYDSRSLALVEYAVGNIAEELFAPQFELWHGKDWHDYLVFLVKPRSQDMDIVMTPIDEAASLHVMELIATQLQSVIHTHLKGSASILISRNGIFPDDLSELYNSTLTTLRKRIGTEQDLIVTFAEEQAESIEMRSIPSLYEMPTLAQLLEAGQWTAAHNRLELIMRELKDKRVELQEHLLEVFVSIASAATYFSHKNGRPLSELIGKSYNKLVQGTPHRSFQQLYEWSFDVLNCLRSGNEVEVRDSRAKLIAEVNQFVEQHLSSDVSLTAISEHVFMHPVYISKIYKLETGENLSDYVYRIRIEKAAHMLLSSSDKVYEIAAQIGYQRAHSFINVFKKHTGLTPQEYRDTYG